MALLKDGSKVRVSRGRHGSGSVIARPEILTQRRKPLPVAAGPIDTAVGEAARATHTPGDLPSMLHRLSCSGGRCTRRRAVGGVLAGGVLPGWSA